MVSYPPNMVRLEPGLRLDRYELICVLANGGMGSVWLARLVGKHGFERLYALKTVLPQHSFEDQYRKMFLDEARLVSRIAHPHIAQTLDLGESQGVLYFVMEWVDGDSLRTLREALTKAKVDFPIAIALRIAADTCAGLHVAHELRGEDGQLLDVVHRDISPQNVLVSVAGATKVIDFGIAKARERLAEKTQTDELKGKVDYMAPEQAVGPRVDRRTDIWSLGGVLYFLLSGVPPFERETKVASLLARIAGEELAPLPAYVPPSVSAIVQKALAADPAARYASAAEMQSALEGAMAQTGELATAVEVSGFVREHLAAKIDRRKRAVQAAVDAATDRQRARTALEVPIERRDGSFPELEAKSELSTKAVVVDAPTIPAPPERELEPPPIAPPAAPEVEVELATGVLRGPRSMRIAAAVALLAAALAMFAFIRRGAVPARAVTPVAAAPPPIDPIVPPPVDIAPPPEPPAAPPVSAPPKAATAPPRAYTRVTPAAAPPKRTPKRTEPPKNKVPDDGF